jgi:hypothetical protein
MSFAAALQGKTGEQQQPQTHQVAGPATMEPRVPVALPEQEQQKAGQSVRAPNVNNLSLDKMLKVVVMMVQQIMTESNAAVLEEAKILAITKIVLNLIEKMANKIHRPLKIIAFNVNGIMKQRYEPSKQLQDLHVDVALFSVTHLNTLRTGHLIFCVWLLNVADQAHNIMILGHAMLQHAIPCSCTMQTH